MEDAVEAADESATAAGASDAPATRTRTAVDILTVFVLSITAVLTAWCGFEASKWGGEMSIAFGEASSARVQAAAATGMVGDARLYDLTIYTQWVLAERNGDDDLTAYIEERFSPEFRTAFDAWNERGRSDRGPFAVPEYVPPGTAEVEELNARADERFATALENKQRGDNYSLLTMLFALVLFLTAMSQRNLSRWMGRLLLGMAIAIGVLGVVLLATFPVRL